MRQKRELVAGIFFVVRMPSAWTLLCHHFEDGEDISHYEWWTEEIADLVAKEWCRHLGAPAGVVADQIRSLTYAFPRGRVTNVGAMTIIQHGSDLERFMKVSRKAVEAEFALTARTDWEFEVEQCESAHKEQLRRYLSIPENWRAAAAS